jgi:hypothetical protein
MFKKTGVANMAYVESEEGANRSGPASVRKVNPAHTVDGEEDADDAVDTGDCGYFGVPCPAQRQCLSAVGVLVFLCWASTIQVGQSFESLFKAFCWFALTALSTVPPPTGSI